jgi:PleD family two-component response regulator
MSIGIAHVHLSRPANIDDLIKHADDALYTAKAEGKRRVMIRRADGSHDIAECDRL